MVDGYTDEEIALMVRDAKRKVEFEINHIKAMAFAEGRAEGEQRQLEENIRTIYSNGFDAEMIAKYLRLDIDYVNEVLNK